MSEQARGIRHEAVPQGDQGLHYNKGIFSEVLVYYDDEAIYFETRGENSSIVRFSIDMLATLKRVVEDKEQLGSLL